MPAPQHGLRSRPASNSHAGGFVCVFAYDRVCIVKVGFVVCGLAAYSDCRGSGMNWSQLRKILVSRGLIILTALGVTVLTTVIVSLVLPKRYTAETSIFVDVRAMDRVAGSILMPEAALGHIMTQVDVIQSRRVALDVVRTLRLEEDPKFIEDFEKETDDRGSFAHWIAEKLLKKLDVMPSRESSIITIAYSAASAQTAADVANAFATAYLRANLALRTEPARQTTEWLDERSGALRGKVEEKQSRVSAYQQEKGIVATDEKLDSERARLDFLIAQLAQAQAQTVEASARARFAREFAKDGAAPDSMPDVLADNLIQNLKTDLAKQEGHLEEARAKLGQNHPQVRSIAADVGGKRQRLNTEIGKVLASIENSHRIAEGRESQLRTEVSKQKTRVLELNRARNELSVLARDLQGAQRAFDSTQERQSLSSLESRMNQNNVAVLSPAEPPIKPSFPRMKINIALAIVMGTLLGVALAFMREIADLRVRTEEDLRLKLDLPVLAAVPLSAPWRGAQ